MSGVEEFDNNIQNKHIGLLARAQETASKVVEWVQDKFESGREEVLPYIGGGALILAGMGVVAGEAQAQESPASLKRINVLEQKWSKDCKKDKKGFHIALVGPKTITEMEKPIPYTVAAMSCTAMKGAKFQVFNNGGNNQDFAWRANLKRGKLFEREIDLVFPNSDLSGTAGEFIAIAITMIVHEKGNKGSQSGSRHWKQKRIPFDESLKTGDTPS